MAAFYYMKKKSPNITKHVCIKIPVLNQEILEIFVDSADISPISSLVLNDTTGCVHLR